MSATIIDIHRSIVERMADGVVVLDRQGRCYYLNPAAERVLGVSRDAASGKPLWEVAPETMGAAFRRSHERLLTGDPTVRVLSNYFAAGRWYEVAANLIDDEIFLGLHDVTERLVAEAASLESEQRARVVIEGVKDYAIYMLDLNGRIASWNVGAERIKGYRADEILGRDYSILFTAEDVKRGKPRQALDHAAADGRYEDEGWRVRKDGSRFWASVVINTLRDESGNPRGFVKVTHDDTERRRAEEAETRQLLALESAEIGTWEYFRETGEVICDARCRAMFGLPPDGDVSYELLVGRMHPDDQPRVRAAVEQALHPETGGGYQIEYRTIGISDGGVERWIAANGKALFDEAKRPTRFLGTVRDISDVRFAQQALRTSEERFRLATSAAHVGTVDYAPTTGELVWDRESKALWGLPPDAAVTYPIWLDKIHPDDRERGKGAVEHALEGKNGGVLEEEYRIRDGDRRERWIAVQGQALFDPSGRAVRLIGTMREVTDLRHAQNALRESEERLSLALSSAELGTWDFSPSSGRLIVDARCCELLGIGANGEVTLERLIAAIDPGDRPRLLELFEPTAGQSVEIEFRVTGPAGALERWIGARGTVIPDARGRGSRSLGAIRDVTERHRFDDLQKRLTGIFAHDLRSPLSAILMGSRMLLGSATVADDARETLATIARSAGRMARMIDQLMDLTRVQLGGGIALELERLDLAAVCRDVVAEAQIGNPDRVVRCIVRGDGVGMFDRESVTRLLTNLLVNAIQHGLPDRPVDLVVNGEPGTVVVEVHNEGPQIPGEVLATMFDPFRRGKREASAGVAPKATRGLGLGLFIAREIIGAHHGEITVHTTKEEGTTFTIRLPRGLPASAGRSADASAPPP